MTTLDGTTIIIGGATYRLQAEPQPEPVCVECGHAVAAHERKGCAGWMDSHGYHTCLCLRAPDQCLAPKRMVPLAAVMDLVNEAVADLRRDLEERAEKPEVKP